MTLFARLLQRLDRDETAALTPLIGFVLLFFAWAAGTVLNTGQVVYDKARAQNAVDAALLAHAEETARDLNVMAMNNLASAQLTAIGAVSFTLIETLADVEIRALLAHADISRSERSKCFRGRSWHWTAFCIGLHEIVRAEVIFAQAWGARIALVYRPAAGFADSQRLLAAFNRMNRHLVATHPRRAGDLAAAVARADGAEAVFVYPPCARDGGGECRGDGREGGDLPVRRGGVETVAAHLELCTGMEHGSDGRHRTDYETHGFPCGRGPYTGGGDPKPHLRDHVSSVSGIGDLLAVFGRSTLEGWNWWIGFRTPPRYRESQSAGTNDFTRRMDRNWSILCGFGGLASALPAFVFTVPETYWLKGRSPASALSPDLGALGLDHPEELDVLALVARDRRPRMAPAAFHDRGDPSFAYAQARVYNPVSFDLYTARWKAKLVPARLMDRTAAIVDALRERDRDDRFTPLRRILEAADEGEWARVNTH